MSADVKIRRGYVSRGSATIHFREAGDPESPSILLLHQSPSTSEMYELLMAKLAPRFHLLAPDTPGFGGSLPAQRVSEVSIAAYAMAMHEFLQGQGIFHCHVFGHHTGASIAVQLEHDYPGTALSMALSGPPLLTAEQQASLPGLANIIPLAENGSHFNTMWERISAKDPEAKPALIHREVVSALSSAEHYQASYLAVTRQPFAEQLPALACPVMVFAGDCDPLHGSVEPSLNLLRYGETVELPGGERTYVCERQVDVIAPLLEAFFERQKQTGQRA